MRAFDDGFHNSLKQMYDHLGVQYTSPKFIYPLSTCSSTNGKKMSPHFIHSSSNHQVPPIRPEGCGYVEWILRTLYLAVCYFWFTACCFLIEPNPATTSNEDESLRQYLERIQLPRHFTNKYLLPLMSSVTTCSHDELLNFPAIDAVDYARRTYRQSHYTVVGGVQHVQTKISSDQSVRLGAIVSKVENIGSKVQVTWTDSKSKEVHSKQFDHVVMAVTPNVVGAIYEPLQKVMSSIPVIQGESVVHRDRSTIPGCGQSLKKISAKAQQSLDPTQILHICSNSTATESIHEHPCSVLVTSFPIAPIEPTKVIHRARLTRVLRTPESRNIVNRIFSGKFERADQETEKLWRNGTGNVWLAGAWCWDGMVLLEGCVVSAMRVAASLDVEVPWLTRK
jgi:predicted NAD/FAD-binding protein